ncbi:MAG: hypothetical protein WKG07_46115 [Hymenobacter sp.]
MKTAVDEIAEGVYRICTYLPDAAPDGGFTFNQFLLDAEEPMLFHCGPCLLFPEIAEATERIMPLERLRWISFGHFESDECGSMNRWLARPRRPPWSSGRSRPRCRWPTWPAGPPGSGPTARSSTSAARGSGASTPPRPPRHGTRACCSTRPPRPCSAATCSPTPAAALRCGDGDVIGAGLRRRGSRSSRRR